MTSRRLTMKWLALGAATLAPGLAWAAGEWPSKTIVMITPTSPGTGTDTLARALAQRLTAVLKQQVIVDNRPGASGVLGISAVHKAPADGHTLLYSSASTAVIAPAIVKSLPYDMAKDFVPVGQTAAGGVLLLVNSEVPAKNMRELIELVKANPNLQLRHLGQRIFRAPDDGVAQEEDRHEDDSRTVQGRVADADRVVERGAEGRMGGPGSPPCPSSDRERSVRSPSAAACAAPRCRTSRRSRSKATGSIRSAGSAFSRPPARRPRSSSASPTRSTRSRPRRRWPR